MWQQVILQSKKTLPDKGFLTLEIIVATLVAFFFLMFSLQALTLSMFLKVKAQEDLRANELIQEDIERVGDLSGNIPFDENICDMTVYEGSYPELLWKSLTTKAPTVTSSLIKTTDIYESKGALLSLYRTHVSAADMIPPFRNLRIFYQVKKANNQVVASRYLEIIPDEALRCP